jgi:hypothetical protein
VTVAVAAGQYAGLVTRYGGPLESNFYVGFLVSDGSSFQGTIWKNIGGTYTQIATGAFVNTGVGSLEFEAVGPSLKLLFTPQGQTQATLLAFADDTSLTTGSVGMRISQGARVGPFNASAVVATQPTLPFSDDFSSTSDGSQLNRNWTDRNGNVTVVGEAAKGTAGSNLSTVNGINVADVTVQATVALNGGAFAGLVARYSGPLESNMYAGFLVSTAGGFQVTIWKNVGGAWTQLAASATFTGSGSGTLKFQVTGTSLQLFWNGTMLASAIDSSLTSGSVGMRLGQNATLDDFSVISP